jgi:hypothetical protein
LNEIFLNVWKGARCIHHSTPTREGELQPVL